MCAAQPSSLQALSVVPLAGSRGARSKQPQGMRPVGVTPWGSESRSATEKGKESGYPGPDKARRAHCPWVLVTFTTSLKFHSRSYSLRYGIVFESPTQDSCPEYSFHPRILVSSLENVQSPAFILQSLFSHCRKLDFPPDSLPVLLVLTSSSPAEVTFRISWWKTLY